MASGEENRSAGEGPANDSIDELLDGLPADPMLPRKRARSIEEVKAAVVPTSQNRRADDKVVVSDGTDPRERAKREAEQSQREHSTFGTAFLQARATREKVIFAIVMMLAVLGIYAFVRHALHSDRTASETPTSVASVQNAPMSMSAAPLTSQDIPPPPASVDMTQGALPATAHASAHASERAPHASESHANKPPTAPSASSSGTRTDVSRSL